MEKVFSLPKSAGGCLKQAAGPGTQVSSPPHAGQTAASACFSFFDPYPVQRDFMAHVTAFLENPEKKFTMLEMPTGTGKTLALLASTLSWLEKNEEKLMVERMQTEDGRRETDRDNMDDTGPRRETKAPPAWIRAAYEAQQRATASGALQDEERRRKERLQRAEALRREMEEAEKETKKERETQAPAASTAAGSGQAAKAAATLWRRRQETYSKEANPSVSSSPGESEKKDNLRLQTEDPQEFLVDFSSLTMKTEGESDSLPVESDRKTVYAPRKTQVIIASRTHSQLRQYVEEIRRIQRAALSPSAASSSSVLCLGRSGRECGAADCPAGKSEREFADAGTPQPLLTRLQVAVLAGRDRLCVNPAARRQDSSTDARREEGVDRSGDIADACALLLDKGQCPFYARRSVLADLALTECMDIEDLTKAGCSPAVMGCPYFAAKEAAKEADVVLLPTSALLATREKEALEASLEGAVVAIDEAHHLPRLLASASSSSLESAILKDAVDGLSEYLATYQDRLHPKSTQALLQLLRFSKTLFDGLSSYRQSASPNSVPGSVFSSKIQQTPHEPPVSSSSSSSFSSSSFSSSSFSSSSFSSSSSSSSASRVNGWTADQEGEGDGEAGGAVCSRFPERTASAGCGPASEEEPFAVFSPSQFLRSFQLGDFALHELLVSLTHPKSQVCRKLRGFLMKRNTRRTHASEQEMRPASLGARRCVERRAEARTPFRSAAEALDGPGQARGGDKTKPEKHNARAGAFHSTCLYTLRAFLDALLAAGSEDKILLRFKVPPAGQLESLTEDGENIPGDGETQNAFAFSSVQVVCLDEVTKCRQCILMGGTMEPRLRFSPLYAALPPSSIFPAFSGSHVIAKENLLLLPLERYHLCTFDSRFSERWRQKEQQEALLHLLVSGASALPPGQGLVVFFSSFSQLRAFSFFLHHQASPALRAAFQHACAHIFIESQDGERVALQRISSVASTSRSASAQSGDGENWAESKKRERADSAGIRGDSPERCQLLTRKGGVTYGRSGPLFEAYKRVLMGEAPSKTPGICLERETLASASSGTAERRGEKPTGLPESASTAASFHASTRECEPPKAALFCVMNGALSEGVNFHDSLARLLVLVGLPFPSIKDPEFQLRAAFFSSVLERTQRNADTHASVGEKRESDTTRVEKNVDKTDSGAARFRAAQTTAQENSVHGRGGNRSMDAEASTVRKLERKPRCAEPTPNGRTSYGLLHCLQTVNQTIGRAIRHSQDYAAVLLVDCRYTAKHIETLLSPWIREALDASRRATEESISPLARDWAEEDLCRDRFGTAKEGHSARPDIPDTCGGLTTRLAGFFKLMAEHEKLKCTSRDCVRACS
ncbi:helicase, putative [Toxoplasma gondii ME49]|uniref:Helicase n=2 Tax=Toxoplasma gondii TaxID=5811 RepID=A0A125YVM6_TOXGV|nr:helicase, putative [Toxoplasma gondii ME49]EPT25509.1 helicase, putative [Toxoplasma gondii ME49]ESS28662.1 putative helicase [Toxoplasma gondii VEG]|eukprot:XP_018635222.1 helicase, putative [Toxoplasma gondii ME49]